MENCCRLVFYNNIYSFYAYFLRNFLGKLRERENENNKLRHHDVISILSKFVCTLMENSSRLIIVREFYLW